MNMTSLLNRTVLATVLVALSSTVFAAGGGGPRGAGTHPYARTGATLETVAADAAPGAERKTHEQVRVELLRAEEAGLVPAPKNEYPPSVETIARNRARLQQIERAWGTNGPLPTAQQ